MINLIKLSENDKRILIALCLVLILLLVLVGYLVIIVKRIMKRQGKVVDTFMYDMVKLKVVKDSKHFRKVANKKSLRYFYKKSWIPVLLMFVPTMIVMIFCLIQNEGPSFLFSADNGFGTLFFLYDWKNIPRNEFFGIMIPSDWPSLLVTKAGRVCTPQFIYNDIHAWISYICVPLFLVGSVWYLVNIQALIARSYRIMKMSKDVFSKNLQALADDNNI